MFAKSLALRILILNLLFIVFPATCYFLIFADWEYEEKVITDIHRLRNIGLSRASYLNQFIDDQATALNLIEALIGLNTPEGVKDYDNRIAPLQLNNVFRQVAFFTRTPDNRFIVENSLITTEYHRDLTYRGYVQAAVKNGYSSYLAYDDITLRAEFLFSKAIHARDNWELLGILTTVIPAEQILAPITNDQYFTEKETVSLLTEDQIVFASSNPAFNLMALFPVSQERLNALDKNKQFDKFKIPRKTLVLTPFSNLNGVYTWTEGGKEHIAFIAPVADKALYIWIDVEKKTISAPYIKESWITVGVLLGITLTSCLITILISQLLSRTFAELISVMDKVSKGDLSVRFQGKAFGFEINEAGYTLNKTLDRLVDQTKIAEGEQLKTEAVSKELKIGREIQESILPHNIPDSGSLQIGLFARPASEVSGDFYDIYSPQDRLIITLADTSGKGLFSCLYSVCLRSMLRAFATTNTEVGQILDKTNKLFHEDLQNTPLNVKTFVGSWDKESSTLHYASASPSFGFVRTGNNQFEPLAGSHGTMGLRAESSFQSYSLKLQPGNIVILYTGGVIEQQNPSGTLYGENSLKAIVDQKAYLDAKELAKAIEVDLARFAGGSEQAEDMTFIVLKIKEDKALV